MSKTPQIRGAVSELGPVMNICKYSLAPAALLALAACNTPSSPHTTPAIEASHRFDSGLWFNGETFESRTAYIVEGRFSFSPGLGDASEIVDLAGGYVIPPLCEGHNHNLGGSSDLQDVDQTIQRYLEYGVFYTVMHGSFDLYRTQIANLINGPESVDVVYSNNGLTGSGGHPRGLREFLMDRFGSYPEFTPETLPDAGYFEADTVEGMREKWALILNEQPDFIKAMLLFSEDYELRKDDPEFFGQRGLNPELLPELVRLADEAGLRVSVHVETEADMVTAINAGVEIIAHLPSHDTDLYLSDEAVALAAQSGVTLVTTLSLARRQQFRNPEFYERITAAQKDNLERLAAAGAHMVLGSDNTRGFSLAEASHIWGLEALEPAHLMTMWTTNCAQMAFPDRRIGRLEHGYEASFLVLADDPMADINAIGDIQLRVKDGAILEIETTEPEAEDA